MIHLTVARSQENKKVHKVRMIEPAVAASPQFLAAHLAWKRRRALTFLFQYQQITYWVIARCIRSFRYQPYCKKYLHLSVSQCMVLLEAYCMPLIGDNPNTLPLPAADCDHIIRFLAAISIENTKRHKASTTENSSRPLASQQYSPARLTWKHRCALSFFFWYQQMSPRVVAHRIHSYHR